MNQQRVLHRQRQRRHRLGRLLARHEPELEPRRNHMDHRQGLERRKRLPQADTRACIEARELELALLAHLGPHVLRPVHRVRQHALLDLDRVALEPALGQELGRLWAPDGTVAADRVRREQDTIAALDGNAVGQNVIRDGGLEVAGDWGVESEGFHEDGIGVAHFFGQRLVRGLAYVSKLGPDVVLNGGVLHDFVVHPAQCLGGGVAASNDEVDEDVAQLILFNDKTKKTT